MREPDPHARAAVTGAGFGHLHLRAGVAVLEQLSAIGAGAAFVMFAVAMRRGIVVRSAGFAVVVLAVVVGGGL